MDIQLLEDIGLTKPQAAAYEALVRLGPCGAPKIGLEIGESRSNAYKVLDKLCELELATKDQQSKKVRYYPANPAALEQFVKRQSDTVSLRERKLNATMPSLLDFFFEHSERPGVRFFQSKEGLEAMYRDQLNHPGPLYFVHSMEGIRFLGSETQYRLRSLFPAKGIVRYGITRDVPQPDETPENRMATAESDKLMLLHRTWINSEDYPDPVEWAAYGDKLAIMSFGQEAMGIIIESPHIANSFRSLFKLLDKTVRLRPDYQDMPKQSRYTRQPLSINLQKKLKTEGRA